MNPWEKYQPVESGPWEKYAQAPPPETTMAQVAMQAVPKGVANLLNTPTMIGDLMEKGLAKLPYAETVMPGITKRAEETTNTPMDLMTKAGIVDPSVQPQTGPQRIVDTAIQAGIGTAIAPAAGVAGLVKNVATGLASGAVGKTVEEVTGSKAAGVVAGVLTPMAPSAVRALATELKLNAVARQTLEEGVAAGYVVPPSSVKPSMVSNKLESIAGKASVRQEAALRNQNVTDALGRKAIGMTDNTIPFEVAIEDARTTAGHAYQAIANISPIASSALMKLREARQEATAYYKHYNRSADPASLNTAKTADARADMLERVLEREATRAGQPQLVPQLREARTQIAKTYDLERALNESNDHLDASAIGRMLKNGRPLTGELLTIGKFARAFPHVTRELSKVPASGVSGTDAFSSAVMGGLGYGAAGGPVGLLAAGLPLMRTPARNLVLSKGYQSSLLKEPPRPEFGTGAMRAALVGKSLLDYSPEEARR